MKTLILFLMLFPSIVLAVDDATVQAIDSKASNANSKAEGNNSRIQALEAADIQLNNRIDTIQLTPGPQGIQGIQGPKGDQGVAGKDGANGVAGTNGKDGTNGVDGKDGINGKSCTALQGDGSATISCEDGSMASVYDGTSGVAGNTVGDMQYWDGANWVLIAAPATNNVVLTFCNGKPTWDGCYAIGDIGPAGGIVFYVTDNGEHGLEAAQVDQSTSFWGCADISNATGTDIGTGANNTAAIISDCPEVESAAKVANAYILNGFNDWFLPSKDELNLLYEQRNVVGNFIDYYWSSSDDGASAWARNFDSDNQGFFSKSSFIRVRAIRAF